MKYILIILAVFMANATFGQSAKEEISTSLNIYFKKMEIHDYDGMVDHIYPKFFEYASREIMIDALRDMMGDTTMDIKFSNHEIVSISDLLELDGISYSLVISTFDLKWQFLKKVDYVSSDPNMPTTADYLAESLGHIYGEDKVNYIKETGTIFIKGESEMYMIQDPAYNGWKMLEKKSDMMQLLSQILPQKVIDEL